MAKFNWTGKNKKTGKVGTFETNTGYTDHHTPTVEELKAYIAISNPDTEVVSCESINGQPPEKAGPTEAKPLQVPVSVSANATDETLIK